MAWFTFLHAQRTSIDDTDARKRVFLARLANLFGETRQSTNPLALQSLAWKGSPKAHHESDISGKAATAAHNRQTGG
jgi:hypothetical protein